MPLRTRLYAAEEKRRVPRRPRADCESCGGVPRASFAENFANAVVDADSEALTKIEATCRANLEIA